MRIAVIDPSLFTLPYDDHLCRALFDQGHSVTLFTRPLRPEEPQLETGYRRSDNFYKVSEHRRLALLPSRARLVVKGLEHPVAMGTLIRDLRRFQPDVIHFQWLPVPIVDRLFLPLLQRIAPTVLTVHDTMGFLNPSSKLQLFGWSRLLNALDRIIVHLELSKKQLVERGVPARQIGVIPHGVLTLPGTSTISEPKPKPNCSGEQRILLFGAIKAYKGPDLLIRAYALLPEELRRKARVVIVGEPFVPLEELKSLARELGVGDRIDWDPRFVPDEELACILDDADILAFPYRRIDASGVLMLVLPLERPIVATSVGCFEELLVDGETARLVPPEDPQAFADALAELIDDPERGRSLALRAKAVALDQLSWDRIAERTIETYQEISASRQPIAASRSLM